jgi:hypothetical protein
MKIIITFLINTLLMWFEKLFIADDEREGVQYLWFAPFKNKKIGLVLAPCCETDGNIANAKHDGVIHWKNLS